MESSSPRPERSWSPRVRWALGVLVALVAVVQAGCRQVPLDDSKAEFIRPNPRDCTGPDGAAVDDMDTYIVEVYDVLPMALSPQNDTNMDCQRCLQNPGTCSALEHPRICSCGGATPATFENLGQQMVHTRVPSLDTDDIYCMRVLAVKRGVGPSSSPAEPCTCSPLWYDSSFLMTNAQLCAIGPPRPVGPQLIELDVLCPGDVPQQGGGGGGNNNGRNPNNFNTCVFPTM